MNKQTLIEAAHRHLSSSELNYISKEKALSDELVLTKMFDEPIIAVAEACSPEFDALKEHHIIGEHFMTPAQWLPEAQSVVSFFFPFTAAIRNSNKVNMSYPSKGWLNARVEGQFFINDFSNAIVELLISEGFKTISPSIDKRFRSNTNKGTLDISRLYTSNWSERHIACTCGLGTFGLSKGIITEKGTAGRLTSIITELLLTPDEKRSKHFDEDCTLCGKCITNCPVDAISFEHGKNHEVCSNFLNLTLSENRPWYGCGKCQINVPCESRNPRK